MRSTARHLTFHSLSSLAVAIAFASTSSNATADGLCFAATPYPVGAAPSDVLMADFNNDGVLDLAVANHEVELENRVSLLLNNGDGTFAPTEFHDVGARPYWLASGDFNNDGWTDVAVTNYFGSSFSVLINTGGTFAPQVEIPCLPGPTFLATADVDLDGWTDVVVAEAFNGTVSLFRNAAGAGFVPDRAMTVGSLPYGVAIADFNGDGWPDIATSVYGTGRVQTEIAVMLNQGAGLFGPPTAYLAGVASVGIAAGDLDADGDADLVTANDGFFAEGSTVSVLLNAGDGTFAPQTEYFAGTGPYDVALMDFNGDGAIDIASGNEGGNVGILLNGGDGTFGLASVAETLSGSLGLAVGDLDGNGSPEIAAAGYNASDVWVLFSEYVGISSQPTSVRVGLGETANFSVTAGGGGLLSYQWRHDAVPIEGATSASLEIVGVTNDDVGLYDVVVTNDCGSLASAAVTLSISLPACPADLNRSGQVDAADLAILLGGWGSTAGEADLDGNGTVGGSDLAILLGAWGVCAG
jgi:hypothetical protein